MFESRYEDKTLVQCEDCSWKGMIAECIHTYKGIPNTGGDVEPIEKCPKCESENLIEIIGDNAPLVLSPA